MKTIKIIAMILGIIIVSSMLVSAAKKEIALDLWESFEFKGVNMTLVAANADSFILCVNNDKNEFAHFVTIGLFSDNFSGESKVMEPDEIVEWRWFEIDNLPTPIYFPSAEIVENYKKKSFYCFFLNNLY